MSAQVFLSYASEQSEIAATLELTLTGEGHSVFHAPTSLPPGEAYDAQIRTAIDECDLFVFLISRASVASGRYTLTELGFAEQKWPHPNGHVLPVLLEAIPKEQIPVYLRAVTMLTPRGNLTAEVAAAVARMNAPWWQRWLKPARLVPAAALALVIGLALAKLPPYFKQRSLERQALELVRQSEQKGEADDVDGAWKLLEQARVIAPRFDAVTEAEERLAMQSLRYAGISYYRGDRSEFTKHADKLAPVITRGVALAKGERLADLLAHQGWSDYLRELGGIGGPAPAEKYRRAIEIDPNNVFGHAMWGFELLRRRGPSAPLAEAKKQFAAALAAKRERNYVRRIQIAALMQSYSNVWLEDPARQAEALKVANDMRLNGEAAPSVWGPGTLRSTLWSIYHFEVVNGDRLAALLAAFPAKEQLETFRWLFPGNDLPAQGRTPSLFDYLSVLSQLQDYAGDRAGALESHRRLLIEFDDRKYTASRTIQAVERARAAIRATAGK